jgi:N-acetylglucosamine-6-phosphate deacetylase
LLLLLWMVAALTTRAQNDVAAEPIVGLRQNRPHDYALQHAHVVVQPGQSIDDCTILISGTSITAVGTDLKIPAGFQTIDCTGNKIYAGLIDAYGEVDVPRAADSEAGYWNANVTPHRNAAAVAIPTVSQAEQLRSQGITARLMAPRDGIVKGTSSLVLLNVGQDDPQRSNGQTLLQAEVWQHLQLTVSQHDGRPSYPNSPMGAVALLRQSLYDAIWYRDVQAAYRADSTLPRPDANVALDTLATAIEQQIFVFDAPNERMAERAGKIADEFSLRAIIRGSGREYRQLDQIVALRLPLLLPVDFPAPPDVTTTAAAREVPLRDLMHWDLAPENPARLVAAGATICLTTAGLEDPNEFLKQVRRAVERGLDPDAALAALTTVPARLLDAENQLGRVAPGMLANLVITDADLWADDTKVLQTWVAGQQFVVQRDVDAELNHWSGRWKCVAPTVSFVLDLQTKDGQLVGSARLNSDTAETEEGVKLTSLATERDRLTAQLDLQALDPMLPQGVSQLLIRFVKRDKDAKSPEPAAAPTSRFASLTMPDGRTERIEISAADPVTSDNNDGGTDDKSETETEEGESTDNQPPVATPVLFPLGGHGLEQPITAQPTVIFRGATLWTCGPQGVIENGDLIVRDGKIAEIGVDLPVPEDCQIIDARGKHITPGIIDCHSHIATDGGINEYGQAISAAVRIGDFIDNSDIAIYRQLAGGTTTANILHGSANPIGGQNQVIKFRWGETMDGLRMAEAPAGIKFALGENVKRSTSRYPNTRMGVEQMIRDQLLAAREYQATWKRWRSGDRDVLPPRRDLQLDAIMEIQNGTRWIHCHSYRQDEIIAMLDVLDEFGIRIGTLQHILEGYKVADRMAEHGAMGSSFADWWAYKFEVFDAIPYNGAIMHQRGIVVSFNSDDPEMGRRLNTEAAKATKYGGVTEQAALQFVTLNPARQLRIDQYVGSLEIGKQADVVVWSGRPLSTMSRCEQTWIDGRNYFSLAADQELRRRDRGLRAQLIQKVLTSKQQPDQKNDAKATEEDRWLRYDVFCRARGAAQQTDTDQP